MKYQVTIRECQRDGATHSGVFMAMDQGAAIRQACERAYGIGAYLFADTGLAKIGIYGQIVRDMPPSSAGWQATCLTDRVKITVEEVS